MERKFLYTEEDLLRFGISKQEIEDFNKDHQPVKDAPHFWCMQEVGIFGMRAIVLTVHISSNGFKYDLSLPGLHGKDHYRIYNINQDLIVNI